MAMAIGYGIRFVSDLNGWAFCFWQFAIGLGFVTDLDWWTMAMALAS